MTLKLVVASALAPGKLVVASALAIGTPWQMASAQVVATAPQTATAVPPGDTPEEIAQDAARDLKDDRFYNKPGATRAQYDADWQDCRLIARGSRTPTGTVPMFYNPALMSPVAAGIAGGIGGFIGAKIAEGQQRRTNRRTCLMIRGWRMIEVPVAEATRIAALTDAQRSTYFDGIVGAQDVPGVVTERTRFVQIADPALTIDAPVAGAVGVYTGKKLDPAAPIALAANEGAVVFAFRRPDTGSAGRSGTIALARYDTAQRDLVYRPKDWKKTGDTTTYGDLAASRDRKLGYEVHVQRLTAGDYVLTGMSVGKLPVTNSLCFGAPTFRVGAGEIVYLGDFVPYIDAPLSSGEKGSGMFYASHIDDARRVLATKQSDLAARLRPAALHNQATYACSAVVMDRWDLPNVAPLGAPAVASDAPAAVPLAAQAPAAP